MNPDRHQQSGRRRGALGGLSLFVCLPLIVGTATALLVRPAAAQLSYTLNAGAVGLQVTVEASGAPVTSTVVDGSGPTAQASLDSIGTSEAFSSYPYPGDAVVTAPGLIAGATAGQAPAIPGYPLYAFSSHPLQPEQRVEHGPVLLEAQSNASASRGHAASGFDTGSGAPARTAANARVEAVDDDVRAVSSAMVEGFAVGPLRIEATMARARAVLRPDGGMHRHAEFVASGVTVGDIPVELTRDGLAVNGERPVPEIAVAQVHDLLAGAGVSLAYLDAIETERGVVSAGVEVSVVQSVPGPITPVTLRFVLGRAAASVAGAPAPEAPAVELDQPDGGQPAAGSTAGPDSSVPIPPKAPEPTWVPAGGTTSGRGVAATVAALPARSAGWDEPASAATPIDGSEAAARALGGLSLSAPHFDVTVPYTVFVVGALALLTSAAVISRQGVRPWTS